MTESIVQPVTLYMYVTVTNYDGEYTAYVEDYPETKRTSKYKQEAIDHALDALRRKLSTA